MNSGSTKHEGNLGVDSLTQGRLGTWLESTGNLGQSPDGESPYCDTCQSPVKIRPFPASQHLFPNFRKIKDTLTLKSHWGPSARGTITTMSARTAQDHV